MKNKLLGFALGAVVLFGVQQFAAAAPATPAASPAEFAAGQMSMAEPVYYYGRRGYYRGPAGGYAYGSRGYVGGRYGHGCVGGRRCVGGYYGGVCRGWAACR